MDFAKHDGALIPANTNKAVTVTITKTKLGNDDVYHILLKTIPEGDTTPTYSIRGRYYREDLALAAFHAIRAQLLVGNK